MLRLCSTLVLAGLTFAVVQPIGVVGSIGHGTLMHARTSSGLDSKHSPAKLVPRACQPGQYVSNGLCTICPAGYYCPSGATARTACKAGTYNPASGSSNAGACRTITCGYQASGGNSDGTAATGQTPCTLGYYSPGGMAFCSPCPAGYYCNSATTCDPIPCEPGTYANSTGTQVACTNCPAGTFNNSYGNTACCSCCAGWYSEGNTGHTNCQQCPGTNTLGPSDMTSPVGTSDPRNCTPYTGAPGQNKAPTTCSQALPPGKTPGTCPATTGMSSTMGLSKRSVTTCPFGLTKCEVKFGRGGWECVDTQHSLETCGGCDNDCSTMTGTNEVGCIQGRCVVKSCASGYVLARRGQGVAHCVPVLQQNLYARHGSRLH